jgi:hypothetical protein
MSIFDDPKNKKMSDLEIASYLVKKEEELKKKEDELEEETRKISGMSMEEARKMVLDKTEKELAGDISRRNN